MENIIYVKDWGIMPKDTRENTYRVRTLLEQLDRQPAKLVFEQGTYHFYPDYAVEKLLCISNHDEDTIKKIVFDLTSMKDITLQGAGTTFMFHSEEIPFYIHDSARIEINGIYIDYARPVYSQASIKKVEDKQLVLSIDPKEYPFFVRHERLFFTGEGYCNELTHGCLEMDAKRGAPVYEGRDISFNLSYGQPREGAFSARFKRVSEDEVEVTIGEGQSFLGCLREGNHLILRHHARTHPAFYITDSQQITLKNITIYHCSGMAVIAQLTEGINIDNVNVLRHPEKKPVFTATADGFHFVYCRGLIQITNCTLENQLDDPVNIHGIYGRIHKVLNKKEMLVELVEDMQKGVLLGHAQDVFGVVDKDTLLTLESFVVEQIQMLNKDYMKITCNHLPAAAKAGNVVENQSYVPDVRIEGCTFRNNRARGLLLTSAGKVMVCRNHFETAGAAILIEGDCNYWFESGAVKEVCIEENCFRDCAYVSSWGEAPIQVSPQITSFVEQEAYHGRIKIRNNTFYCFDERILSATGVDTIEFVDNCIHRTDSFPPMKGERFMLREVHTFRKVEES